MFVSASNPRAVRSRYSVRIRQISRSLLRIHFCIRSFIVSPNLPHPLCLARSSSSNCDWISDFRSPSRDNSNGWTFKQTREHSSFFIQNSPPRKAVCFEIAAGCLAARRAARRRRLQGRNELPNSVGKKALYRKFCQQNQLRRPRQRSMGPRTTELRRRMDDSGNR